MLIGVPVSFGIALFLTELSPNWLKRPLGTAIELLAAIPSIIYGMWGLFVFAPLFIGEHEHAFWHGSIFNGAHNHILHAMHEVPAWVPLAPTVMGVAGIALAYGLYMIRPGIPAQLAERFRPVYLFLLHKWYFDELYDAIFIRPARRLAELFWKTGDARIIDGMPNGAADLALQVSRGTVRLQTGRVANYAFAMIIGLVVFVSLFLIGR
jgi:NADH-quinone oxidoreductase subunit L